VRWTETCYCPTPLEHERATVLDRYFTRIETRVIDKPETFDGMPLVDRACGALDPRLSIGSVGSVLKRPRGSSS
jgi:hypothetical protein